MRAIVIEKFGGLDSLVPCNETGSVDEISRLEISMDVQRHDEVRSPLP